MSRAAGVLFRLQQFDPVGATSTETSSKGRVHHNHHRGSVEGRATVRPHDSVDARAGAPGCAGTGGLVRRGRRVPRGRNQSTRQEPDRNQPALYDEPAFRMGGSDNEPPGLLHAMGLGLALVTRLAPRLGSWLIPRLLCAGVVLPALIVAGPEIEAWAWLFVAWGIAVRLVPLLERSAIRRAGGSA